MAHGWPFEYDPTPLQVGESHVIHPSDENRRIPDLLNSNWDSEEIPDAHNSQKEGAERSQSNRCASGAGDNPGAHPFRGSVVP
jgi:hypothetical protein